MGGERLTSQPLGNSKNKAGSTSFSDVVKEYMGSRGYTNARLVEISNLSKTTISRVCRNSNDKGSSYIPTLHIVMAIGIGLKLNHEETKRLLFSAFPEMALWSDIIDRRLNIHDANEVLYENGFPLLGNVEE